MITVYLNTIRSEITDSSGNALSRVDWPAIPFGAIDTLRLYLRDGSNAKDTDLNSNDQFRFAVDDDMDATDRPCFRVFDNNIGVNTTDAYVDILFDAYTQQMKDAVAGAEPRSTIGYCALRIYDNGDYPSGQPRRLVKFTVYLENDVDDGSASSPTPL